MVSVAVVTMKLIDLMQCQFTCINWTLYSSTSFLHLMHVTQCKILPMQIDSHIALEGPLALPSTFQKWRGLSGGPDNEAHLKPAHSWGGGSSEKATEHSKRRHSRRVIHFLCAMLGASVSRMARWIVRKACVSSDDDAWYP